MCVRQKPGSRPHFATETYQSPSIVDTCFDGPPVLQISLAIVMALASVAVRESLRPNLEINPGNQHGIYIAVAAVATSRLFSVDGASQWTNMSAPQTGE